jgi:hypothetical protein
LTRTPTGPPLKPLLWPRDVAWVRVEQVNTDRLYAGLDRQVERYLTEQNWQEVQAGVEVKLVP